ncbi:type I restriction-modification enzyme R subunit C-terminal domain-containing protein [Romeriopsis navalis]|uniref:type I restriction-modification enzyme R subunit C-terminal domain-containing protein n=1 Tax=Romeriopsis navalis TaxID=2992132 RepID=UPI0021F840F1|nr:type I restriction-modification enzyme R subunit C-terminal domain-containing protein [Romeriopsis navalis]
MEFKVLETEVAYHGEGEPLKGIKLRAYVQQVLIDKFQSLDHFSQRWLTLLKNGSKVSALDLPEALQEQLTVQLGKEYCLFDCICSAAFDQTPITRRDRAENVRLLDLSMCSTDQQREILDALLDQYIHQGIAVMMNKQVLQLPPFTKMGTLLELLNVFGGKRQYEKAVGELARMLYDGSEKSAV